MPLRTGKKNFTRNVKEMIKAGHPKDQAVAAAYSMLRKKDHGFYGHMIEGQKGQPIYGGQMGEC